jgi:hypothetical protein
MKKILIPVLLGGIVLIIILATALHFSKQSSKSNQATGTSQDQSQAQTALPQNSPISAKPFLAPISRPSQRVTKKFFGTYVTPQNSPVQPERFTGYHTGVDYETFAEEQNLEVDISAICNGKLLRKAYGTGYGGYAVQACTLNGQAITIVYGHLKLASIIPNVAEELKAGDKIGILGAAYSTETDGERKHLHLGIHKGAQINIAGYVSSKSQLSAWIDPLSVIQQ